MTTKKKLVAVLAACAFVLAAISITGASSWKTYGDGSAVVDNVVVRGPTAPEDLKRNEDLHFVRLESGVYEVSTTTGAVRIVRIGNKPRTVCGQASYNHGESRLMVIGRSARGCPEGKYRVEVHYQRGSKGYAVVLERLAKL